MENAARRQALVSACTVANCASNGGAPGNKMLVPKKARRSPALRLVQDTATLLRFRGSRHLRSPGFLAPRMVGNIVYALLLWSVYAGVGSRAAIDAEAAQSLSGLFFATVVLSGYGASPFVPSMCLDRPIFYRDRADGYYGPGAYVLAKLIEDTAVLCAGSALFSVIVFYGCGLQGSFGVSSR